MRNAPTIAHDPDRFRDAVDLDGPGHLRHERRQRRALAPAAGGGDRARKDDGART
jgi:hypothetical protein